MSTNTVRWYMRNRKYAEFTIECLKLDFQNSFYALVDYLPTVVFAIFTFLLTVLLFLLFPITYLIVRISGEKARKKLVGGAENELDTGV